jgi:quercetin dioxygenase-like cupin family protein/DNA-binding XRE family transcriptional regulator
MGEDMTSYAEDVGLRLGSAIRTRRHQLGMTLVEVAASAGLSHPFLSQLERGLARPSMRSLTEIAATLGTTAQALMAASELPVFAADEPAAVPAAEPVSIVRHVTDKIALVDSPGGSVRPLVRGERAMLPVEFNGAPRDFDEYYRHDGEEFVYVVRGLIEIEVEGELHTATAGDSVYYPGGYRHRWRSLSDEEVRLVVVQQNLPPNPHP